MHHSLVDSELKPDDWAVFPGGGGGVGIQGIQLAKAMGFRPIAVDSGKEKRWMCLRLGAEAFIDFREVKDAAAEVVKIADGKGAHAVFVTAPQAYKGAQAYLGSRIHSKILCIGLRK
jgi:propanol-preferring alcohol dehydrogenase